jgi:hypothetical protein
MRWVRCGGLALIGGGVGILFGGCAAPSEATVREPVVAEVPAKVVRPPVSTVKPSPPRVPAARPSPSPRPQIATTPPAALPPPPSTPQPDTDPAPPIRGGVLESESPGQLAFVRAGELPQASPGLYEDAIILSALRAALKADGGADVADSARVSSGEVALDVPAETDRARVAAFVDAAFAVPGVRRVAVNLR